MPLDYILMSKLRIKERVIDKQCQKTKWDN